MKMHTILITMPSMRFISTRRSRSRKHVPTHSFLLSRPYGELAINYLTTAASPQGPEPNRTVCSKLSSARDTPCDFVRVSTSPRGRPVIIETRRRARAWNYVITSEPRAALIRGFPRGPDATNRIAGSAASATNP